MIIISQDYTRYNADHIVSICAEEVTESDWVVVAYFANGDNAELSDCSTIFEAGSILTAFDEHINQDKRIFSVPETLSLIGVEKTINEDIGFLRRSSRHDLRVNIVKHLPSIGGVGQKDN